MKHVLLALLMCLTASVAVADSYYKDIQEGTEDPLSSRKFKKLEEKALEEFSDPAVYRELADAFGASTEKVWALIYGMKEVFRIAEGRDKTEQLLKAQQNKAEEKLTAMRLTGENYQSGPDQVSGFEFVNVDPD